MVWQQQNKIFFLGTKTASSPFVKILQKTTTAGFVCLFRLFFAKSGRLKKSEQANRHNRNFFNKKVYRVRLKWSSKPKKKSNLKMNGKPRTDKMTVVTKYRESLGQGKLGLGFLSEIQIGSIICKYIVRSQH